MSAKQPFEIERKWLVTGWPEGLEPTSCVQMRQGYVSTHPVVRIRESKAQGQSRYVLCFKGEGTLVRREIETDLDRDTFCALEELIGKPMVEKELRTYQLPGGLVLEVNRVDAGQPTEFFYAEVEFSSVAQARAFTPPAGLALGAEQTETGFSMSEYWRQTRG